MSRWMRDDATTDNDAEFSWLLARCEPFIFLVWEGVAYGMGFQGPPRPIVRSKNVTEGFFLPRITDPIEFETWLAVWSMVKPAFDHEIWSESFFLGPTTFSGRTEGEERETGKSEIKGKQGFCHHPCTRPSDIGTHFVQGMTVDPVQTRPI
jgi:hypothetical protein